MKTVFVKRCICFALVLVTVLTLACVGALVAYADTAPTYVDFLIQDHSRVTFSNGDAGFQRVNLKSASDRTPTVIPDLIRTDSLDYEFDGWYYGNTKVTEDTEFADYAVIRDRWNAVPYDTGKIISSLSLNAALPIAGMTQSAYLAACGAVSQNGLWVSSGENFTLYEGLHAKSGNELSGTVEDGKDYSAKITLRVDYAAGYRIGKELMPNVSATNGVVSDVRYIASNGAVTDCWTSDIRMVSIIINFANNDFVTYPTSQYVANGQEPHVSFSTTYPFAKSILQHKTGYNTWNDLYTLKSAAKGEFVLPAFINTTETFCIYTVFPDGQVKVGDSFTVVFGEGASDEDGRFLVQPPTSVDLALNEDYTVPYLFSRSFDNMWLDMWKGYWAERVQFHNNGLTTISGYDFANSIQYRIAISYVYNGENRVKYSDVFTVNWVDNAASWTVSFEGNGGTGTMADVPNVSGDFVVPECGYAAPNGKEFDQWVSDGVRYNPGDHVDITRAKLFVALWKPVIKDSYSITFQSNGGSGKMELMLAKYEEEFVLPECGFTAPAGKKFDAWWVNGGTYHVGDTVVIKKDTELVAAWVDDTYAVSFQANGGEGVMSSNGEAPAAYTLPDCEFTAPAGKQFVGWAVGSADATPVAAGQKVWLTQNSTLYAVWADNDPYSVVYNDGLSKMIMYTLPEGSVFDVASFEALGFVAPAGKVFSHWEERYTHTDNIAQGSAYTVPADDVLFKAVYISTGETVCTVQFGANGQSGSMEPIDVVAGTEFTLPLPAFTAPAGTQFVGWVLGGDITNVKAPFEKITITATTDLDALWRTPLEVVAEYEGRVIVGESPDADRITIYLVYDDGYREPILLSSVQLLLNGTPIADVENCSFNAPGPAVLTVRYDGYEDAELAFIVINQYHVSFDGNGGKGVMEPQAVVSPTYTLPENKFVAAANKVFKCWSIGGVAYAPGQAVTLSGDIAVTAVWESLFAVSFRANGGGGEMISAPVKGGAFSLPATSFTAPEGKQFKGWATSADGEVIVGTTYNVAADVTLFAIWEDIPHTHTYGTEWKTDATNHWNECACGDKANTAAHADADADGKCDACGYVLPVTAPDPTDDEDNGLSGGAVAGIVVGSVAVVGIGGFSLYWFVIKKKKFSDLLAIFKKK